MKNESLVNRLRVFVSIFAIKRSVILLAFFLLGPAKDSRSQDWIRPKALQPGDRIAIIAPASPVHEVESLLQLKQEWEAAGYEVQISTRLTNPVPNELKYLSGSDEQRVEELNAAIRDPQIRAIVPARGGYGLTRILDDVDYQALQKDPKIVAGYSDITALHLAIARKVKMITFHSPNASELSQSATNSDNFSSQSFQQMVFANQQRSGQSEIDCLVPAGCQPISLQGGKVTGRLIGGNLALICALQGTPYAIDPEGAILFLEDVDEAPYRVDRMMSQLRMAGVLDQVAGVVVGQFTIADASQIQTLEQVMRGYLKDLSKPVIINYPIGHVSKNATLPHGGLVELDGDAAKLKLLESPVSGVSRLASSQNLYRDAMQLAYTDRADDPKVVEVFHKLADDYGTPLYIYDQQEVVSQYQSLHEAFRKRFEKVRIFYALKANSNPHLVRTLGKLGAGAEVVSEGELRLALHVGIPGRSIIFTSSSKSKTELELAVEQNVLVNVDSLDELEQLQSVAEHQKKTARISIRINPDVNPDTLAQINTGKAETKFGIPIKTAVSALERVAELKNLKLCGLHCHIGSQITTPEGYELATEKMLGLAIEVSQRLNLKLEFLDLGGGFGIVYRDDQSVMSFDDVAAAMYKKWELGVVKLGYQPEIWLEPGRSMVAKSGVLLTRVNSVKANSGKTFVNVDAGFNTLARPAMYGAFHRVRVIGGQTAASQKVEIAGCICETGDILATERLLPPSKAGDLLLILDAGAYGFSMASRYNSRPLPAEVMIESEGKVRLIRRRESSTDLWESVPD